MKLDYIQKLKIIRPFVTLNIRKTKNNVLTPTEKRQITVYFDKLIKEGFIRQEGTSVYQVVKFVKSKKVKNKKFKGYWNKGAIPSDKINRNGDIISENTVKTFIPIDFKKAYVKNLSDKKIEKLIEKALINHGKKILKADYFTLVTANGYEVGRGQFKNFRDKKGIAYAKGLSVKDKIKEIARVVALILRKSIENYKISENLLSGLYLYRFKKQRQPNKREFNIIFKKVKK